MPRTYIAIDLKSFYASVECRERGLDPLTTNLVVADESRTEKTICLAVSPALKSYGIPGRPRLFEVVQRIREVNELRRRNAPGRKLTGESYRDKELKQNSGLAVSYLVAPPRMAYYLEYSTRIYQVYLKYAAPEDIHVYSIDEVFIDATHYLAAQGLGPHDFAMKIIRDVLKTTGITATAGIGTNLYLAKIAMDVKAKKMLADADGVRIAELDEMSYRRELWDHRPLTSFWRVGRGYARKLEEHGMFTMGDVTRCSLTDEDALYRMFGVNAELLIDHAWGWEPTTIAEIKAYRPETNSISSGQVLQNPYPADKARLVVWEMCDLLALDLVDKGLVTDQLVLTVGYDIENLTDPKIARQYRGAVTTDAYGRKVPKHAHGTENLRFPTASGKLLTEAVMALYDRIIDARLLVRRITLAACKVVPEADAKQATDGLEQLDFFSLQDAEQRSKREDEALKKERKLQEATLELKKKFGKNAVLKATNLEEGATARERNRQIGGHKA